MPAPFEEPRREVFYADGRKTEATRFNTKLSTYIGKAAIYNHVYINPQGLPPLYVFECMTDYYSSMKEFVEYNDFPQELNNLHVQQRVVEAMVSISMNDVGNTIPEEWNE
jgi:hypothetical protein